MIGHINKGFGRIYIGQPANGNLYSADKQNGSCPEPGNKMNWIAGPGEERGHHGSDPEKKCFQNNTEDNIGRSYHKEMPKIMSTIKIRPPIKVRL